MRIAAGIVLALAVLAAAVATVIVRRRRSVPATQGGEAALPDTLQDSQVTDLHDNGSQTDATLQPQDSLAALSTSVPEAQTQTLVLPETGSSAEHDVEQGSTGAAQLESAHDASWNPTHEAHSQQAVPEHQDVTATAVIDQHEHSSNEKTDQDGDAGAFWFDTESNERNDS